MDGQLAPDFIDFRAEFFERVFHGAPGKANDAPVKIFIMGGGSGRRNNEGRLDHGGVWRGFADWPPPEAEVRPFYLAGDGKLSEDPAPSTSRIDYRFDPLNPVPTIGGAISSGEPVMRGGAFDQREGPEIFGCAAPYLPLSSRPDVLTFETPLLEQDITVCGPVILRLWVASDAPDTDFTMKLIDVHPPSADYAQGFAMIVTDGILRMRYRDSMAAPTPMIPGDKCAIEIEAFPTANRFLTGHRIRLDVSSSNFPKFDVNPNTGEPEGQSRQAQLAINTILHGGDTPSAVLLPVLTNV